jgi:hypothetical protein
MDVEFAIESLSVIIYTNIPDKQYQMVNFSRSMLHIPNTDDEDREQIILEDLPYFTIDVEYPVNVLTKLDYYDRVDFFFNANKFVDILRPYYNKRDNLSDETTPGESFYDVRERRTRKNIMTMLEILFPTKFPVINDIQTSHDFLKDKQSTRPLWFNPFQKHYFSYLKIGGNTYTVKKTVWLNDILNHPLYRKMVVEYRKLRKWADEELYSKESQYETPEQQIIELDLNIDAAIKIMLEQIMNNKFAYVNTKEIIGILNELNKATDQNTRTASLEKLISYNLNNIQNVKFQKYMDILTENHEEIKKVANNRKKIQEKNDKIQKIFTTSLSNIGEPYNNQVVIRKFQGILNEYSEPFRKTSNNALQTLIDSVLNKSVNDPDNLPTQYYTLLDIIYEKYIKNNQVDSAKLKVLDDSVIKLMNVGISYINIGGDTTKPTKEVYFLIDMVDGKIQDDNVSSIYCPYIGDYLGTKLEYLINKSKQSSSNSWAVDNNRQMFSLKKIESSITNNFSENELVSKDSIPTKKNGPDQLTSNLSSNSASTKDDPSANFKLYIMMKEFAAELDSQITNLQYKYLNDTFINSLNSNNIINILKTMDKYPIGKKLYLIIEEWNANINRQDPKVLQMINGLIGEIKIRNANIADEKESRATKDDKTNQRLLILKKEEQINNMLESIANNMLIHEKSKRQSGGTRRQKKRVTSKKNTRKYRL